MPKAAMGWILAALAVALLVLTGLGAAIESEDAADALAVALCHLQNEQFRARFALPSVSVARTPRVAKANVNRSMRPEPIRIQPAR